MLDIPDGSQVHVKFSWSDVDLHGEVVGRLPDRSGIDPFWYAVDFGAQSARAKAAMGDRGALQDFGKLPARTGFAVPPEIVKPAPASSSVAAPAPAESATCPSCRGKGKVGGIFGVGARRCADCCGSGEVTRAAAETTDPSSPARTREVFALPEAQFSVFRPDVDPCHFHQIVTTIVEQHVTTPVHVALLESGDEHAVGIFAGADELMAFKLAFKKHVDSIWDALGVPDDEIRPDRMLTNVADPGNYMADTSAFERFRARVRGGEFEVVRATW